MAHAAHDRATHRIAIARHPLYPMLLPIPVVCFTGALLADIAYVQSDGNLTWLYFSNWLITAGLVFGGIAAVLALIDVLRSDGPNRRHGWTHFGLFVAAWVVEFFNAFIHQRDGWTAVVPTGMILSIIGVVLILASGWLWQSVRYFGERA
jgi:uncharacterized membrane protein